MRAYKAVCTRRIMTRSQAVPGTAIDDDDNMGAVVGEVVGDAVEVVGADVGATVGAAVGAKVAPGGNGVGALVGAGVGTTVGDDVGTAAAVSVTVSMNHVPGFSFNTVQRIDAVPTDGAVHVPVADVFAELLVCVRPSSSEKDVQAARI